MKEDNKTTYTCEYCGKSSYCFEEIEECEKNCKYISDELEKLIESCNKLNNLGCSIELREYPYYDNNKLDLAAARRLTKDYRFVFRDNEELVETVVIGKE